MTSQLSSKTPLFSSTAKKKKSSVSITYGHDSLSLLLRFKVKKKKKKLVLEVSAGRTQVHSECSAWNTHSSRLLLLQRESSKAVTTSVISFRKGTCWLTTHARAKWEAFVPPPLYTLAGSGSRSLIGRVFLIFSTLQQGRRSFITFCSQWLLSGAYRTANEWVRTYISQFPLFLPPRGCFAVAMACAVSQRRRWRRPTKTNSPPPPSLWLSFGWHGRKRSTKKNSLVCDTRTLRGVVGVFTMLCESVVRNSEGERINQKQHNISMLIEEKCDPEAAD